MKTLKKVPVKHEFVAEMPPFEEMKEAVVYISKQFGCAIHRCLCGCGEQVVMSLKPNWKNGWNLVEEKNGTISFTPSIGNYNFLCKSHYIITKSIANFV